MWVKKVLSYEIVLTNSPLLSKMRIFPFSPRIKRKPVNSATQHYLMFCFIWIRFISSQFPWWYLQNLMHALSTVRKSSLFCKKTEAAEVMPRRRSPLRACSFVNELFWTGSKLIPRQFAFKSRSLWLTKSIDYCLLKFHIETRYPPGVIAPFPDSKTMNMPPERSNMIWKWRPTPLPPS